MRRNGHKTTFDVKLDLKFDFPVTDFLYDKKLWKLDHYFMHFSQFSVAHAQKRPEFNFLSYF